MRAYISDGDVIYQAALYLAEITKLVYKSIPRIDLAVGFVFLRNEKFRNKVIKQQTPKWLNALKKATHGENRGLLWQNYEYATSIFFYIPNLLKVDPSKESDPSSWKGIYYGSFSATEVYEKMQAEPPAEPGTAHEMFRLLLEPTTPLPESFGILALPDKARKDSKGDNGVILWDIPEQHIKPYTYSTWNPNTNQIIVTRADSTYVKVPNEDWVNRAHFDLDTFKRDSRIWKTIQVWARSMKLFSYSDVMLQQLFELWKNPVKDSVQEKYFKEWEVAFGEALFLSAYSNGDFSKRFWSLFRDATYNHLDDILISVFDSIGKRPYRFVKFRLTHCASSLRLYHGYRHASFVAGEWDKLKKQYAFEHQGHQWGPVSYTTIPRKAYIKFGGDQGVVLTIDFSDRNKITVKKYPNLHLVPLPEGVSIHKKEGEILLGDIPVELIERYYNHPKK